MAAKVDIPVENIIRDIQEWVEECSGVVANAIAEKAIRNAESAFVDQTGNLRKSIIAQKSKFTKDAWIVGAMAPHAHLIEYGHYIKTRGQGKNRKYRVRGGRQGGRPIMGHVAARPFFIPAVLAVVDKLDVILADESITVEVKK